jgi:hypothetical protein
MNRAFPFGLFAVIATTGAGCGGRVLATSTSADSAVAVDGPTALDAADVDVFDGEIDASTDDVAPVDAAGPPTSAVPPPRPTTPSSGGERWFAVNALHLGLTDRATGMPNINAWKSYGFDLDGRNTGLAASKENLDSCTKVAGAPSNVLLDGNLGTDNNFGSQVMTVLQSLKSDNEATINAGIIDGSSTLLLRLQNVDPSYADGTGVTGAIYIAHGGTGFTPKFDVSDHWPIVTSSLVNATSIGDASNAVVKFPAGYVSGGYWVSGPLGDGTVSLSMVLDGVALTLPLQSGVLTVRLSDGSDGTIAGAVTVSDLVTATTPLVESFGICPGNSTFTDVIQTITQSADLVTGAPQLQDTSVTCNAVSIGLGFTVQPTGVPTTTVAQPPNGPNACAVGG